MMMVTVMAIGDELTTTTMTTMMMVMVVTDMMVFVTIVVRNTCGFYLFCNAGKSPQRN